MKQLKSSSTPRQSFGIFGQSARILNLHFSLLAHVAQISGVHKVCIGGNVAPSALPGNDFLISQLCTNHSTDQLEQVKVPWAAKANDEMWGKCDIQLNFFSLLPIPFPSLKCWISNTSSISAVEEDIRCSRLLSARLKKKTIIWKRRKTVALSALDECLVVVYWSAAGLSRMIAASGEKNLAARTQSKLTAFHEVVWPPHDPQAIAMPNRAALFSFCLFPRRFVRKEPKW